MSFVIFYGEHFYLHLTDQPGNAMQCNEVLLLPKILIRKLVQKFQVGLIRFDKIFIHWKTRVSATTSLVFLFLMGSCSCIDLEASRHLDVELKYPLCIKSFIHSVCSEGVSFGANLKLGGTGQQKYICMQQNS